MTPFYDSADVTIYNADARDAWRWLPEHSANAIVTSPPYYGLRDYDVDGQVGLEDTPAMYVNGLADLLTSYGTRVLAPGGSLWLSLGDSYASTGAPQSERAGATSDVRAMEHARHAGGCDHPPKCLLMIPERVALALIDRGWTLRNKVVWAKPNGMPTPVRDRLATKWEYVFHLVRQRTYFYDLDAIRKPPMDAPQMGERFANPAGANPGDVWTIPTQPYRDAHFAAYPQELVRRPILATVPEQVCRGCGRPRERITATTPHPDRSNDTDRGRGARRDGYTPGPHGQVATRTHHGWSDCGCAAGWMPGTVLDPFLGSGTTAVMARRLGRRTVGVELNPDYCRLAADRFAQQTLPLADTEGAP